MTLDHALLITSSISAVAGRLYRPPSRSGAAALRAAPSQPRHWAAGHAGSRPTPPVVLRPLPALLTGTLPIFPALPRPASARLCLPPPQMDPDGDLGAVDFWGAEVPPGGKPYAVEVENEPPLYLMVHVTGCALGEDPKGGPHVVKALHNGKAIALATLEKGRTHQVCLCLCVLSGVVVCVCVCVCVGGWTGGRGHARDWGCTAGAPSARRERNDPPPTPPHPQPPPLHATPPVSPPPSHPVLTLATTRPAPYPTPQHPLDFGMSATSTPISPTANPAASRPPQVTPYSPPPPSTPWTLA